MKINSIVVVGVILVGGILGRYLYKKPGVGTGNAAPEIIGTLATGEAFQLSSLRGKYVLLDFWASWCGPCIEESPGLRNLYLRYHGTKFKDGDDFEIVSVSLDRTRGSWLNAIARLPLSWKYHVSDLQDLQSPLAKLYGVRVIPTKFLLDAKGEIILVNPSILEVQRVLDSRR